MVCTALQTSRCFQLHTLRNWRICRSDPDQQDSEYRLCDMVAAHPGSKPMGYHSLDTASRLSSRWSQHNQHMQCDWRLVLCQANTLYRLCACHQQCLAKYMAGTGQALSSSLLCMCCSDHPRDLHLRYTACRSCSQNPRRMDARTTHMSLQEMSTFQTRTGCSQSGCCLLPSLDRTWCMQCARHRLS